MLLNNQWIISFIVNLGFFFATLLLFWVSIRDFKQKRNVRSLIFNAGLLVVASSYLVFSYWAKDVFTVATILPFVVGLTMIGASLSFKTWHYMFGLGVLVPFLLPPATYVFALSLLPALIIVYLAYRNYCKINCSSETYEAKLNNNQEGREWAVIIFLLLISFAVKIISCPAQLVLLQVLSLLFLLGTAIMMYLHVLYCINFTRQERVLLPLMVAFIIVTISLGFLTTLQVTNYNQKVTEVTEKQKANATLVAAQATYPNGEFENMIEAKDSSLNDFADSFYAKTGYVTTYFLGNERIAATPSMSGAGRLVGTTIEDENVKNRVLAQGEEYSGNIVKGGVSAIAAYVPIFKGDQVIGMIGTGTFLTNINELQTLMLFMTLAGATIVMGLVLGVTFLNYSKKIR